MQECSDPPTSTMKSDDDFTRKMVVALSNTQVRGLMVAACDESIEKYMYIEMTDKRFEDVEMEGNVRDMRLDEIDARLGRFEEREDNIIIICGLKVQPSFQRRG